MTKELQLDDKDQIGDLKIKLWKTFDLLQSEPINKEEYQIIFYFLVLYNFGFLDDSRKYKSEQIRPRLLDINLQPEDVNTLPYEELKTIYEPILYSISDSTIHTLIDYFFSLNQKMLNENFSEIFDDLLQKFLSKLNKADEYLIPQEVLKTMAFLADFKENDKFYNPFAGTASFGVLAGQKVCYSGQEINRQTWALGGLNMLAHSIPGKSTFILSDPIVNWNPLGINYDSIIVCPPFDVRLKHKEMGLFGEIKKIEHFILEKGIENLNAHGKLIMLFPQSFMAEDKSAQKYRKFLIEEDLIEMVIYFPGGLLGNTAISFSLILINKDKKEKGSVFFVNAEQHIIDSYGKKHLSFETLTSVIFERQNSSQFISVTNDLISSAKFNFSVTHYLNNVVSSVPLNQVVSLYKGQRNNDWHKGKLIQIKDLKVDKMSFLLDLEEIETVELPNNAMEIKESCLLISGLGLDPLPTYIKVTTNPVYIASNILALTIDQEKIDIAYLVYTLHSRRFDVQWDEYRHSGADRVKYATLYLSLKVELPPIFIQKTKMKGIREAHEESKQKEKGYVKKIHGLENEIIEQNSYLRHSLAGPVSNLKNSIENIQTILVQHIFPSFPELMKLKVSENYKFTLEDYINFMDRDSSKISKAVNRHLKVETDISSKKLEFINFCAFIQNYIDEYQEKPNLGFQIQLSYDEEYFLDSNGKLKNVYILGNEELLIDMLDNLIKNAVDHAFLDSNDNRIEIYLSEYLAYIEEKSNTISHISILLSNTGKPFPVNFIESDFRKNGSKSDFSSGDGFGGYYISEIIKKHNGWFDIIDERGPEGIGFDLATSFEIFFPIIEDFNNEEV